MVNQIICGDFNLAEVYGEGAIKSTFKRLFEACKNNAECITELCTVLNWRIWDWYEKDKDIAKLYETLWGEVDAYCVDNLTGDDLKYFLKHTD